MTKYLLDTYALIEIIKGNPNYTNYLEEELSTSIFHLYELFYNLLKSYDTQTAQEYYSPFSDLTQPIKDLHIFQAAKFKFAHIKAKISYADALGYAIATVE